MDNKNKITMSTIISKTILFIFIIGFVVGFKTIFGTENTLIGAMTITALLMFLGVDLSDTLFKSTFKLILLNVGMGIASFIAMKNAWIGLPINFIVVFIINYLLYFSMKNPLYLPFILQYDFILFSPITIDRLPIRLVSLLVAPLMIFIVQFLLNKGNGNKKSNKVILSILDKVTVKINHKLNNESDDLDLQVQKYIASFRGMIYTKRIDKFYITEVGERKLFLITGLEKLWLSLAKIDNNDEKILKEILEFTESLKDAINNKANISKVEDQLTLIINNYNDKYIDYLEIINSLKIIKDAIADLITLGEKEGKMPKYQIPKEYLTDKFTVNSIRFSYVIRSAFGISLAVFIVTLFNLSYGKWMVFTVAALVVPIYEASIIKTKDKLFATIIGVMSVIIIFSVVKDVTARTIIILLIGYINNFLVAYRYMTIINTISALGTAAVLGNVELLSFDRIFFVIIGAILAILINKFMLRYDIEDYTNELEALYIDSVRNMLQKVYRFAKDGEESQEISKIFIFISTLEGKIADNNKLIGKELISYVNKNKLLTLNIYELYIGFRNNANHSADLIEEVGTLVKSDYRNMDNFLKSINSAIDKHNDLLDKIVLENIKEIFIEVNEIKNYLKAK